AAKRRDAGLSDSDQAGQAADSVSRKPARCLTAPERSDSLQEALSRLYSRFASREPKRTTLKSLENHPIQSARASLYHGVIHHEKQNHPSGTNLGAVVLVAR